MAENKATEKASEKEPETSKSSDFLGAIGDAAKAAWSSVRDLEQTLLRTGSEGDNLPTMRVATDDKSSNKYWEIFGKEASFDSKFVSSPLNNLERLSSNTPPSDTSKDTKFSGPMAWIEQGWAQLFGGGNKYEREKRDAEGHPTRTEWGPNGVDHTEQTGKTHVDRHGAFHMDIKDGKPGDQATMDRDHKTFSERGANGALAVLDASGKLHVADGLGNKIEWQNGQLTSISRDGTRTEITDEHAIRSFRGWMVEQRRHGAHHESTDRPSVTTVTDDVDKVNQMVVVDDGKGTVVKIHQDGSKEITVGTGDDQTTFMTKPDSREILAMRGDELYVLKPGEERGQWDAFDIEGNKIGSVDNILGGHARIGRHGHLELSHSTAIGGDGTLQTSNEEGQNIEIANDSGTAVIRDACGGGRDVRISAHGRRSHVVSDEAAASTTTTVDTETGAVNQDSTTPDGKTNRNFSLDPTRSDHLHIGTTDGDIKAFIDANGNELIEMWNKDIMDARLRQLRLHDGTIFDEKNGTVNFNDGTWIDAFGALYDGSVRIGSLGEYWEENEQQAVEDNQVQAQMLAGQAEALAAAICSKPGNASLNDVGSLLALYSQLSGLKSVAASLGDFNSFSRLDSGIAATDNAINNARVQIAQQEILNALGGISPDLLAQAHNQMPGSVLPEALKQFLVQRGVIPATATQT
jgi:hypothetical protein